MSKRKITKRLYRKNVWNRMVVDENIYADKRQARRYHKCCNRMIIEIRERLIIDIAREAQKMGLYE